jgi:hypothetical protein
VRRPATDRCLATAGFRPFDDSNHYDDCRRAAHVAVIKARGRAGKCLISEGNSAFGDSSGTLAEFLASSPPQDVFRVELLARSFVENWLPTAENAMLLFDADGVPDWPRGVETIRLFTTGEPAENWRGILSKLHRSDGRRRSASLVSITAFRQANGRPPCRARSARAARCALH